jgi:ribosomal protein L16 Arg81 hydroxylase
METAECPMRRTAGSSEAPAGFARILEAPPPGSAADAERIRRYEWLLETMERQRGLSEWHRDIQRIRNVDAEDFLDGFYAPGRPVVIEGAMEDWPALERWTPEHLRRVLGETAVEYQGGRDSSADYELHKDRHKSTASMAEFLDLAESRSANDAYITAYNNDRNAAALAPLDADIGTPPAFLTSGMGMKWIGPAGTFTPLHFDLTNNLLAQVTGRKQIVLLPPSETRHLAHSRHVFSDMHDITDEVCLRKYPAARRARRYEIELRAGEMLFVPIGWWHQVRSLEFSTMLTFTNFIWANESFRDFV